MGDRLTMVKFSPWLASLGLASPSSRLVNLGGLKRRVFLSYRVHVVRSEIVPDEFIVIVHTCNVFG